MKKKKVITDSMQKGAIDIFEKLENYIIAYIENDNDLLDLLKSSQNINCLINHIITCFILKMFSN